MRDPQCSLGLVGEGRRQTLMETRSGHEPGAIRAMHRLQVYHRRSHAGAGYTDVEGEGVRQEGDG